MKIFISLIATLAFIADCKSNKSPQFESEANVHKVVIQEVIQVSEYTYLRVLEDDNEKWLAVPSIHVEIGKTYYYMGGMEMSNFESKELKKSFKTIYFIEKISADPNFSNVTESATPKNNISQHAEKPTIERKEINIKSVKGAISIAELLKNKKAYEGKIIKVSGEVTKFNPAIMNKNWVHLQDGSEYNGEFDLTLTTNEMVKVGDVVTLQGKVLLDQDFGYGYLYNVIIENAELVQ